MRGNVRNLTPGPSPAERGVTRWRCSSRNLAFQLASEWLRVGNSRTESPRYNRQAPLAAGGAAPQGSREVSQAYLYAKSSGLLATEYRVSLTFLTQTS